MAQDALGFSRGHFHGSVVGRAPLVRTGSLKRSPSSADAAADAAPPAGAGRPSRSAVRAAGVPSSAAPPLDTTPSPHQRLPGGLAGTGEGLLLVPLSQDAPCVAGRAHCIQLQAMCARDDGVAVLDSPDLALSAVVVLGDQSLKVCWPCEMP